MSPVNLTPPHDPQAQAPLRNEDSNDSAAACPACGQPFTPAGRRRWCSDACRQTAWRRRHPAPGPAGSGTAAPPAAAGNATIYQCPECRLGPGGACPHCDEPVAIKDLTTVT